MDFNRLTQPKFKGDRSKVRSQNATEAVKMEELGQ